MGLSKIISKIPNSDLQTLLLEAFKNRAESIKPNDLMNSYLINPYLGVSELDQREIIKFDSLFYEAVPKEFSAVELSLVCPIGINSVLAKINQNNVLSTIRNLEVIGDPTIALALECAARRKQAMKDNPRSNFQANLATSQRLLRLQPFDKSLGYMQHFKCFGMCTAGRDCGHEKFQIESLKKHIKTYLEFIRLMNRDCFGVNEIEVYLSDIRIMEEIIRIFSIDRKKVMENTQNPSYCVFAENKIGLAETVPDITDLDQKNLDKYGINKHLFQLIKFQKTVLDPFRKTYPEMAFGFDLARIAGIGYYENHCFHIYGKNKSGLRIQLADGGFTDWTKKLLNNKKEALLTSGFGADLCHKMFRR